MESIWGTITNDKRPKMKGVKQKKEANKKIDPELSTVCPPKVTKGIAKKQEAPKLQCKIMFGKKKSVRDYIVNILGKSKAKTIKMKPEVKKQKAKEEKVEKKKAKASTIAPEVGKKKLKVAKKEKTAPNVEKKKTKAAKIEKIAPEVGEKKAKTAKKEKVAAKFGKKVAKAEKIETKKPKPAKKEKIALKVAKKGVVAPKVEKKQTKATKADKITERTSFKDETARACTPRKQLKVKCTPKFRPKKKKPSFVVETCSKPKTVEG